jgi:hypothetical protein
MNRWLRVGHCLLTTTLDSLAAERFHGVRIPLLRFGEALETGLLKFRRPSIYLAIRVFRERGRYRH